MLRKPAALCCQAALFILCGVLLFLQGHAAHLLRSERLRGCFPRRALLLQCLLRPFYIVLRCRIAAFELRLHGERRFALLFKIPQVLVQGIPFFDQACAFFIAAFHVPADNVEFFRTLGEFDLICVEFFPECVRLKFRHENVFSKRLFPLRQFFELNALCFQRFGQLRDFAFSAKQRKLPFLHAAAAHGAARADEIAGKRGNAERAARALFERNTALQIAHDDRAAKQVFHDRTHCGIITDQLARHADTPVRIEETTFLCVQRTFPQKRHGQERCAAVIVAAQIFNDRLCILRRRRYDILKRRPHRHGERGLIFLRHTDQLRDDADDRAAKPRIPSRIAQDAFDGSIVTLMRTRHLVQNAKPRFRRPCLLFERVQRLLRVLLRLPA